MKSQKRNVPHPRGVPKKKPVRGGGRKKRPRRPVTRGRRSSGIR